MKLIHLTLVSAILAATVACSWIFKQAVQMADYCTESVRIVKIEQLSSDDGKYEDEAYRLTYSDGTYGLYDQATPVAGELCRKQERMSVKDGNSLGLRKITTYLVSDYSNN